MTFCYACDQKQIPSQEVLNPPVRPQPIPKIQTGQRQVAEYQEGGSAFEFGSELPHILMS